MISLLVVFTTLTLALIQDSALCHAFQSTHQQQRRVNIPFFRSHNYGPLKPVIAATKIATILHAKVEENQEIPVLTFRLSSDGNHDDKLCVIIAGELNKDSTMETVLQSQGVCEEFDIGTPSEWKFMVKKNDQSFFSLRWNQFRSLKVHQFTRLQNVDEDYLVVFEENKALLRKVERAKLEDPILPPFDINNITPTAADAKPEDPIPWNTDAKPEDPIPWNPDITTTPAAADAKFEDPILPPWVTDAATTPAAADSKPEDPILSPRNTDITTITAAAADAKLVGISLPNTAIPMTTAVASNGDPIVDTWAADSPVSGIDLAHTMGVATQSDDYDFEMVASQAIRGNLKSPKGFKGPGTYAHTKSGRRAWWRVDFNTPITTSYVRVYGRPKYGKRLQSVTVRLLSGVNGRYEVVQEVFVLNSGSSDVFAVRFPIPVAGINRVELHKPFPQLGGDDDTFNLNAVQIFD